MRNKILRYLAIIFLLFAAGGGLVFYAMQKTTSDLQILISLHRVETFRQDLIISIKTVQNNLFTIGTTFGPELDIIVKNVLSLDEAVNRCQQCHHSPELTKRLQRLKDYVEKYKDALSAFITTTANPERLERLKEIAAEVGNIVLHEAEEMTFIAHKKLQQKTEEAIARANKIKVFLVLTLFGTMIFGFFVALTLTKDIMRPVEKLKMAVEKMAAGQLGYSVDIPDPPEFSLLARSFNHLSQALKTQMEKTQEYVHRLRELHRVTLLMHLTTDRETIIGEFISGVNEVLRVKGLILLMQDEDNDLYKPVHTLQQVPILKEPGPSYTEEELKEIYQHRPDDFVCRKDEEVFDRMGKGLYNAESLYIHWIVHTDRLLGALLVVDPEREITPEDSRIMDIICNNFAVAIENVHLYENLQRQMEALKEAQDQLIQAAKLAAIGELAATIAHELNNPLTTILGYTELMKEEEQLPEHVKKDLDILESESLRARDIVRQLLEFSRKRPLQLSEVDLNDTIQEVITFVSPNLRKSSVRLVTEFAPLPSIMADRDQLKQVFLNLINNAIQAMPEGGTLSIKTGVEGHEVLADVSDTGVGIPEDILPRIFEPFFSTKKEKGTGLGLSISYRIVEEHGGRILVKSIPGKGTTFRVLLPIRKGA